MTPTTDELDFKAATVRAFTSRHWAMLTDAERLAARFAEQLNYMIAERPKDWRRLADR